MARKVRIQYPGAIYHVMNRGDRREAIFEDDEHRERLLQTLTQACQKTGWQVQAYCLMRNRFRPMASGVSALSSSVANGCQVLPMFPPPPLFIPYGGFFQYGSKPA
jgi:hypothetical protein